MKLLIILPVFLLAALLVWIAADGQRGGARETLPPAGKRQSIPLEGSQTADFAPEAATEEVLKAGVSETEGEVQLPRAETEPEDPHSSYAF